METEEKTHKLDLGTESTVKLHSHADDLDDATENVKHTEQETFTDHPELIVGKDHPSLTVNSIDFIGDEPNVVAELGHGFQPKPAPRTPRECVKSLQKQLSLSTASEEKVMIKLLDFGVFTKVNHKPES